MELRVSSPCPKSWDELVGDHRVRFCGQCRLNVYNLADMSREEAERIVRKTEGRLRVRLYMRGDQTATAEDCPRSGLRKRIGAAVTVSAVLFLGILGWSFRDAEDSYRSLYPSWVQSVINWFDPPLPRKAVMGIAPPRIPPPPAPPPPMEQ